MEKITKEPITKEKAFEIYYAMGSNRSIRKLHSKLSAKSRQSVRNLSLKTLERWSKAENWQERIRNRDQSVRKKVEEKAVEKISDVNLRHLEEAVLMQEKGREVVLKSETARFRDGVLALEKGISTERLIRGEATSRGEIRTDLVTLDDLRAALADPKEREKELMKDKNKQYPPPPGLY